MCRLTRLTVAVLLVLSLLSVSMAAHLPMGGLEGTYHARPRRQADSESEKMAADESSSVNALDGESSSDLDPDFTFTVYDAGSSSSAVWEISTQTVQQLETLPPSSYVTQIPSSDIIFAPSSQVTQPQSSVYETHPSIAPWSDNFDTSINGQPSDYVPASSTLIDQTTNNYNIVVSTAVVQDLSSHTFLDQSQSYFPSSDVNFSDESSLLQSDELPLASDKSTLSLHTSGAILTDSTHLLVSTSDWLDNSLTSTESGTVSATANPEVTDSLTWIFPELSMATGSTSEFGMSESVDPSLSWFVSESMSSFSLSEDMSQSHLWLSVPAISWSVDVTDMQTFLTSGAEEGTTITIFPSLTATYTSSSSIFIDVPNSIDPTMTGVTDSVDSTMTDVTNSIELSMTDVTNSIDTTMTDVTNSIELSMTDVTNSIEPTMTDVTNSIEPSMTDVTNSIEPSMTDVTNSIDTTMIDVPNSIEPSMTDLTNSIEPTMTDVTNSIEPSMTDVTNSIEPTMTDVTNSVESTTITSSQTTTSSMTESITGSVSTSVTTQPPTSTSVTTQPPTTTTNNTDTNNTLVLPDKQTQQDTGLSTGSKVAIGVLVPVAIIILALFGFFFFRRYRRNRYNSKNFLGPAVSYRTYTNSAYKEDEVVVDGNWRRNH